MMKKIIMIVMMLILMIASVFASSVSTTRTSNGYDVTYVIDNPGWYLLPTEAAYSNAIYNPSMTVFNALAKYKFFQSPLTLQFEQCKDRVGNKLTCPLREQTAQKNEDSLAYNAAWSYYTQPTFATFHYDHSLVAGRYDQGQLRKGWNLVTFPPHLAYGKVYLNNCAIMRAYAWNVDEQGWNMVDMHALQNNYSSLSGKGMAVKVARDCNLVQSKENYALPYPAMPLMPGIQ